MTYLIVEWDQETEPTFLTHETAIEGFYGLSDWSDSPNDAKLFDTLDSAVSYVKSRPGFFSSLTYVVPAQEIEKIDLDNYEQTLNAILHQGMLVEFDF